MSVRRSLLFLTAGALATGGTLAAAPAANAESAPTTYSCSTLLGAVNATVVTDTDLPAVMHVGDSLPVGLTSTVTVPWFGADGTTGTAIEVAYDGLGARTATGTATANGTITAPDGSTVSTTTDLTVPTSTIEQFVGLTTNASGTGDVFAPTAPGTYTITAGDFSSTLHFLAADGTTEVPFSPQTIPCTAPTDVSTLVDTVTVKAKSTTSLTLARASAAYGQRVQATATVGTNAGAASGSVQFTAGGKTVTAPVSAGKATALLPVLPAGGQRVTATFKPSSTLYDPSSATKTLSVTKAATRTTAAMTAARLHRMAKAKVAVTSAAGVPTGRVTVVLKKGARTVARKVVTLRGGKAAVALKRIVAKGRYSLTVTYPGTHDLAGSKVVKQFRVRR